MSTSKQAVVYCRISRDAEGEALGVERQEADCKELADRLGLEVVRTLPENDISASTRSKKRRPLYEEMVALCEAGDIRHVIVYSQSRLTRRPLELEQWIDLFERKQVVVHSVVSGDDDLGTADGRMVARLKAVIDAAEAERTSERCLRTRDQMAARGAFRGGPRPFGYEANGIDVRLDEAEALAVAAAELLEGLSLNEVTRRLKAKGHTTTGGHPLDASSVRRIIMKPRNAGLLERNGGIVGPGQWPAILDETVWRGVCALLNDPKRRTTPGPERRWLLSGVATCGVCGAPLAVRGHSQSDRHTRPAYICKGFHVSRDTKAMDDLVISRVLDLLESPDLADLLTPARPDVVLDEIEAAQIRADLEALAQACGRGDITPTQMATASKGLQARLEAVNARLGQGHQSGLLSAHSPAQSPALAFLAAPLVVQRQVVQTLVEVVVSPGRRGRPKGHKPGQGYADLESVLVLRRSPAGALEALPALQS